ncbi:hypothetical protein [Fodinicola acaciae]|uniref:hypothetical protein n=1 Tax=Fodinicola acaciae TaxID=2681555 RepID=UPI0013D58F20|nr:hypothetical protein [Fodinicola acaciae]
MSHVRPEPRSGGRRWIIVGAIAAVVVVVGAVAAFFLLRPSTTTTATPTPSASAAASAPTAASPSPKPVKTGACPQSVGSLKPRLVTAANGAIGAPDVKNVAFVTGPLCDGGSYAWGVLKAQDAGGNDLDPLAMIFKVDGSKVTVAAYGPQCLRPDQFPAGTPEGAKQSLACDS